MADTAWMSGGFLLRRAQRVHTSLWNDLFGNELTGPQYSTLIAIARWPGSDQQTLGELTGHDKATMGGIIERLETRALVERTPDPGNLRRYRLDLNEHGRASMAAFAERATAVHDALLDLLPEGSGAEFVGLVFAVAYAGGAPQEPRVDDPGFPVMSMSTSIGHLLRRAHQNHAARWNEIFAGEITTAQYSVLAACSALEVPDLFAVAELAGLDLSSAGAVITRMEKDGWLVKVTDEQDKRRRLIHLTPVARIAARWSVHGVEQVEEKLLGVLGEAERERLAFLARQLIDAHDAGRRGPRRPRGTE
ncbi:winged helix-turn-helix transcriptional regulator [Salinibacterium sp. dk2585]|uniref:MarR family winged helix-turn-helix transcriptional regulator n=1 Tax=unclassified Salinibacterium TaxID=2632331 RepID=UPI0011C24590|nr:MULTISPECIES: MarR family winged helix-turn-helix transcriptional regulator [unclassified Salinibacterium]QEE60425.1 winged helix-turn-helix transcriptional regulator [Salinibacterium sp. dk2585]TXK55498.1 winged helix-turn-helix transcriptional regulator [Salinibacterium sp. dk5596]